MEYNGQVAVGGPWQSRKAGPLSISKLAVGPLDNNTYLLRDSTSGDGLLIDAANEADRILDMCDGSLTAVLTTHCHPDHWQALATLVSTTRARTYAAAPEAPHLPVTTQEIVGDGDTISLGTTELTLMTLTGHRRWGSDHICTSLALAYTEPDGTSHIFTGDALFPGGVGNTCDDRVAYTQLLTDVTDKIFDRFSDEAWIYPGHGFDAELAAQRRLLPTWSQ